MKELFKKYQKKYIKLSKKEQDELFKRWQQGDKEAGEKLLCAFFPLIARCYGMFCDLVPKHLRDDYADELVSHFFVVASYYDPERGRFSTLYVNSAKNLTTCFRKQYERDKRRKDSFRRRMEEKQEEEFKKKDEERILKVLHHEGLKEEIEKALTKLSYLKRKVVCMYFGLLGEEAKTLEQIGEDFGMSDYKVKLILDKSLKELRKHLKHLVEGKRDDSTTKTTNPSCSE